MAETWRYTAPREAPGSPVSTTDLLIAAGASGVWERVDDVVAYFPTRDAPVPPGGEWSPEPDRDWHAAWTETLRPVRIGGFTVVPTWLAARPPDGDGDAGARDGDFAGDRDDDRSDRGARGDDDGATVIVLDPGRAFGSGHHATTALCLEAVHDLVRPGDSVLDVGCGSGILAVAAALRGASPVVAVDVEHDAVAATREAAARNGAAVDVRQGGPEVVDGAYDLVLGNLLTHTVIELAPRLAARTRGHLVVSGIGVDRAERALAALTAEGLRPVDRRDRDGWTRLTLVAP